MKIFYALQATGNGHISRAMELLPYLQQYGEVDFFLSGNNSTLHFDVPIKFRSKGLSLYYTCTGTLNYIKIFRSVNPISLKKEINNLPLENYDLIINDYDYITAKACKAKEIPSVNFGHQASFQSNKVPRPKQKSVTGEWILKKFATGTSYMGLHFKSYDDFILTPVIKHDILKAVPQDNGYITVYLPSYCETQLKNIFTPFKKYRFEIFSRETTKEKNFENICFKPVSKHLFNQSLINCNSIITGAGFETPSEALHLGKKIMAIPIGGQYEQMCNAAALAGLGVMTLSKIDKSFADYFDDWEKNYAPIKMDYSDTIPQCMNRLFA